MGHPELSVTYPEPQSKSHLKAPQCPTSGVITEVIRGYYSGNYRDNYRGNYW